MLTMTHPPDSIPLSVVIEEIVATLMAYVNNFVQRQMRIGDSNSVDP